MLSWLIFIYILILNNLYEDLINRGIIIPIIGGIISAIVGIIIKYIYSRLKKKQDKNISHKQHRKGRKG